MAPKSIPASKFKEQCLGIMDNLGPEGLIITKHGKPVAKLLPLSSDCKSLIGCMKGKVGIHGNILRTGVTWDAES